MAAVFELYRGLWGSPLFFFFITGGGGGGGGGGRTDGGLCSCACAWNYNDLLLGLSSRREVCYFAGAILQQVSRSCH